jgi:hypothetical protein
MNRLLGVLVSSIISKLDQISRDTLQNSSTYPNIVSLFHQFEGQAPRFIRQAYPHLTIHKQPMVHINNRLPYAVFPIINLLLLPSPPRKTM